MFTPSRFLGWAGTPRSVDVATLGLSDMAAGYPRPFSIISTTATAASGVTP